MSRIYKINLLPVGSFFFGQELIAELGNRQNYFQRSARFPQQSTLLGLLRHQLLLQNGLARPAVAGATAIAEDLIGLTGFEPVRTGIEKYGKIIRLSPLFLQKENQGHYFLHDRTWVTDETDGKRKTLTLAADHLQYSGLSCTNATLAKLMIGDKPFTAKSQYVEHLVNADTAHQVYDLDKVFVNSVQAGVYKYHTRPGATLGDENNAYFKFEYQQALSKTDPIKDSKMAKYYAVTKDWSFAFYAELENEALEEGVRMVIMGKEQSLFRMTTALLEAGSVPELMQLHQASNGILMALTLRSDTYVPDEHLLLEKATLVNGSTTRFRSFTIPYASSRYYRYPPKSNNYNLLKRGTVIYSKHAQDLIDLMTVSAPAWRQIGNNHFTITAI